MCTGGLQQVNFILHFLSVLYICIQGEWNKLTLSSLPHLIKVIFNIRFIRRSKEDKVNLFHFPCAAKSKCIIMFLLMVSFSCNHCFWWDTCKCMWGLTQTRKRDLLWHPAYIFTEIFKSGIDLTLFIWCKFCKNFLKQAQCRQWNSVPSESPC